MKEFTIITLATLVALTLSAQHHSNNDHSDVSHPTHDLHHSFHKHHIAVFNGGATNFEHHISAYAMGIDYEYRFMELLGVGLTGEYLFLEGDEGESIFALPIYIHPLKGLKLSFGPIGANAPAHEAEPTSIDTHAVSPEPQHHAPTNEWHFGSRINMGYDIPIGKMTIGPIVGMDMINHTKAFMYELSIGVGF